MKIVTIIGARPQFIKAVMVSRLLAQEIAAEEILVHTGQHYDANMSNIFFEELQISKINYHLGIGSHSHGQQTGAMLSATETILLKEKPTYTLTYGDTNSTLAGALAAAKLNIPVAHVEAGLRSFNRKMPEEINRIITDQVSELLFAPTHQAVKNLVREGLTKDRIVEVGDVMYDAALFYANLADNQSNILEKLNFANKNYILATIHRAENTTDLNRLNNIFKALDRITQTIPIIMPLHPRTKKILQQKLPQTLVKTGIVIIEPIGFLDMIKLEKQASLIITDSGGIQKEAFFYQVPCVTLRNETEWVETITLGWNILVASNNPEDIYHKVINTLGTRGLQNQYPYGKGNAAKLIVQQLCKDYKHAYMDN